MHSNSLSRPISYLTNFQFLIHLKHILLFVLLFSFSCVLHCQHFGLLGFIFMCSRITFCTYFSFEGPRVKHLLKTVVFFFPGKEHTKAIKLLDLRTSGQRYCPGSTEDGRIDSPFPASLTCRTTGKNASGVKACVRKHFCCNFSPVCQISKHTRRLQSNIIYR